MTLEHIALIVLLIALTYVVAVPASGPGNKVGRITAVVACVVWTILQFASAIPVR